jgi:hypothetical protein
MRLVWSNIILVFPALFTIIIVHGRGRVAMAQLEHPVINPAIESWAQTLNLINVSFSGLMFSLLFICLIYVSRSTGIRGIDDGQITLYALNLLGVGLPYGVNGEAPPVLTQGGIYFYRGLF